MPTKIPPVLDEHHILDAFFGSSMFSTPLYAQSADSTPPVWWFGVPSLAWVSLKMYAIPQNVVHLKYSRIVNHHWIHKSKFWIPTNHNRYRSMTNPLLIHLISNINIMMWMISWLFCPDFKAVPTYWNWNPRIGSAPGCFKNNPVAFPTFPHCFMENRQSVALPTV